MNISTFREKLIVSGLTFLAIFYPCAHAQINWLGAQSITGNGDLIDSITTPGAVTFDAFLTNSGTDIVPLSVDGVTFNISNVGNPDGSTQGDGLISYSITAGSNSHYGFPSSFPTSSPSSPEFAAVMNSGGTYQNGGAGAGTITLSGLTLGNTYAVQIFNYAPDGDAGLTTFSSAGGNSVTISNLPNPPSYGQYATGTFTATSTSQSFDWTGAGSNYTVLGAINVADVTAVPEPATSGLIICSFATLLALGRAKHKKRNSF